MPTTAVTKLQADEIAIRIYGHFNGTADKPLTLDGATQLLAPTTKIITWPEGPKAWPILWVFSETARRVSRQHDVLFDVVNADSIAVVPAN